MTQPRRALPTVAVVLAATALLAACGGAVDATSDPAAAGSPTGAEAGGGAGTAAATSDDAAAGFPVTIEHAFGETTIESAPERVVTWGWGSTDAVLALGEVPVAIPQATYGADEEGLLPWVAEELEEVGADTPTLLPDVDGVPFEQVAAQQPDVILAVYSGLTEEEYTTLSEIAPVVAYPDEAWSTPWREVVTTVGTALGMPEDAQAVVEEADAEVAEAAEAHPELEGTTVAAVADTADAFYVYEAVDPRVQFLTDLGMEVAPSVEELSTGESTFFYTLSPELVGRLGSDVLLSYAETPEQAQAFLDKPYATTLPQVRSDAVASVVGADVVASVSPPTALSLSWALDTYVDELSRAAQNAR